MTKTVAYPMRVAATVDPNRDSLGWMEHSAKKKTIDVKLPHPQGYRLGGGISIVNGQTPNSKSTERGKNRVDNNLSAVEGHGSSSTLMDSKIKGELVPKPSDVGPGNQPKKSTRQLCLEKGINIARARTNALIESIDKEGLGFYDSLQCSEEDSQYEYPNSIQPSQLLNVSSQSGCEKPFSPTINMAASRKRRPQKGEEKKTQDFSDVLTEMLKGNRYRTREEKKEVELPEPPPDEPALEMSSDFPDDSMSDSFLIACTQKVEQLEAEKGTAHIHTIESPFPKTSTPLQGQNIVPLTSLDNNTPRSTRQSARNGMRSGRLDLSSVFEISTENLNVEPKPKGSQSKQPKLDKSRSRSPSPIKSPPPEPQDVVMGEFPDEEDSEGDSWLAEVDVSNFEDYRDTKQPQSGSSQEYMNNEDKSTIVVSQNPLPSDFLETSDHPDVVEGMSKLAGVNPPPTDDSVMPTTTTPTQRRSKRKTRNLGGVTTPSSVSGTPSQVPRFGLSKNKSKPKAKRQKD